MTNASREEKHLSMVNSHLSLPNSSERPYGPLPRRERGFTLIELILVMALLALSAAMVAPSLTKFAHHRRAADAATDILAFTRFRPRSGRGAKECPTVYVDHVSLRIGLTAQRGGNFVQLATSLGRNDEPPRRRVRRVGTPLLDGTRTRIARRSTIMSISIPTAVTTRPRWSVDRPRRQRLSGSTARFPPEPFHLSRTLAAGQQVVP